jgi:hypothetical protein
MSKGNDGSEQKKSGKTVGRLDHRLAPNLVE